ncbi:MAG: acetyl-CoA carboxylase biotin carboxyl carrier protein [Acidobacteria bacterium]|nr:acetyl-CoA carboxylase biotin carboxyl carrier protein [Acidobacteriota bacterium]
MNVDEIRSILELVREHDLTEFELEVDGTKIKVKKAGAPQVVHVQSGPSYPALPAVAAGVVPLAVARPAEARPASSTEPVGADMAIVKSPIVGTFYRAPEPGAPPFVETGAHVKKGQVLCIIEAMKLMNEIESDYDGEIVAVYVENAQAVQYGERLFAVKVK